MRGNDRVARDPGVDADALRFGEPPREDASGRGREVGVRVLGVEPRLDRVASDGDVPLRERQRPALRDLKLQPHEIDACYAFGDGVLDLDARIHLKEVEAPAVGEQKLDRARADVADRRGRLDRRRAHHHAKFGRDGRGGRLLDQLLMPALDRAVALAEMDNRPLLVAEHLHLDVTRPEKRLLQQKASVAECVLRLRGGRAERGLELTDVPHDPHAAAPTARARLDHHRKADALGLFGKARETLVVAVVAWRARHARGLHARLGRRLVAHCADRHWRRSNEDEAGRGARTRRSQRSRRESHSPDERLQRRSPSPPRSGSGSRGKTARVQTARCGLRHPRGAHAVRRRQHR